MKKMFLIFPFILLACTESGKTNKSAPAVTDLAKKSVLLTYVVEQNLKIQDTDVFVKMAIVEQGPFEIQNWVLITTPRQTLSYVAYDHNHNYDLKKNLSPEQLDLLKGTIAKDSMRVDLDIPLFIEMYRILNTLELSRCRSAKVWKDLVKFAFSKRQTIYFNAAYSLSSPWALAWDMDSQTFKDIASTSPTYRLRSSYYKETLVLLTPQQNIYSQNERLLADSRFVSLSAFSSRCDFGYSINAFDRPEQTFLPRYDEENDRSISTIIDMDLEGAVLSTDTIYFSDPSFSEDDINYANKLNLLEL